MKKYDSQKLAICWVLINGTMALTEKNFAHAWTMVFQSGVNDDCT